ncbi:MAG: sulfatase-like hydrolase/transferase, partial [Planctomycetota bacterium]
MNVIQIVCDTLRPDYIGAYGNPWIRTPNLDRLAAESVVFENAYAGSFPTLPHRTDLFTGRYAFRKFGWEGLPAEETPIASLLSNAGVKTQFILDNPHLISFGRGFDRGFGGSEWIRGQED